MYRTLLGRFPEDPNFNYRLGISYFLSNDDLNEAYKYLKISSTKEVSPMVYFYLGEVCRYLFRFNESLEYYKRFMMNGGSSEVSKVTLEMAASAATNGQNLLKFAANIIPLEAAKVAKADFYKSYDTYATDEGFGSINTTLLTSTDKKKGNSTLMFSRRDGGVVGDISVYASYGNGETGSLDLYYIEKQADGTWSRPQRLPSTINSPFDENYPYMSPDNKTLYFSSKGLYSVGGYDIYKSTYNEETKEWSAPENMGFPINSAYDDMLFVPGEDGTTACFASTRGIKEPDMVNVYKVSGFDNTLRLEVTAQMALELQPLTPKVKGEKAVEAKSNQPKLLDESPQSGVEQFPGYRRLKAMLANNDMLADSTVSKIERLRTLWESMPDAARKNVERLIYLNEKKLTELNDMHNTLTEQAIAMEQDFIKGNIKVDPEAKSDVDTWFVQNPKLSIFLTPVQLDRMKQSPLKMSVAMSMVDSIQNIKEQIDDVSQIVLGTSGAEKDRAVKQMELLNELLKKKKNTIVLQWGWFYTTYYEIMTALSGAAVPSKSEADSTLLGLAEKDFLSAKGIRNGVDPSGDTDKDYTKLEEAFQTELRSLNRLNLYLAQLAGEVALSDSLKKRLFPAAAEVQEKAVSPKSDFGRIQREEVSMSEITFSGAPAIAEEFDVVATPVYSQQSPIPAIATISNGVFYAIQLGSFSQQLSYARFPFSPMFYDLLGTAGVRKVFAGVFARYQAAADALPKVKANGFKDAFIVAFIDKKMVPIAKARQVEGKMPAVTHKSGSSISNTTFRVVLGTFKGELPKNVREIAEKYVGDKEIIKSSLSEGANTYSIGNFSNFDEAIPLKDKLISEGIVEAFVTRIDLNQISE